ncbi:aminotransferase class I/II-fold pyridoxal phosphate-dependent enzyme [bacterium]|nr:aminotransferase class I/II-fold pyridoxal phosphate-dependent enzyme [bacterium]
MAKAKKKREERVGRAELSVRRTPELDFSRAQEAQRPNQRLAERVSHFRGSACLEAKQICERRRREGLPVYDFGIGETKGALREEVREAGISAYRESKTGYMDPAGIPELRDAVVDWLDLREHYSAENVVVTVGAKQSIFNTFAARCDPGDALFVECAPWVSYLPIATSLGIRGQAIDPLPEHQGPLKVTAEALEHHVRMTPRTKLVLVNTPCNPTGQVYNKLELESLLEVCLRHNLFLVVDMLYWRYLYDDQQFPVLTEEKEARDALILIDGFSKNFRGAGGLRIGWTVAPRDITQAMIRLQSHTTSGASTPAQYAALAAVTTPYDDEMVRELQSKRDLFEEYAAQIDGISFHKTRGAYYSFWDVRELFGRKTESGDTIENSDDLMNYLIEEAGVVGVTGTAFERDGYLRFMFHIDDETIREGLTAAKEAIHRLQRVD